jgi:hypothetical protein
MRVIDTASDLATSGWVVQANLADVGEPADLRFFAVGLAAASDAEQAILRYPGMVSEDKRIAIRPLSAMEIHSLGLRPQAVRSYNGQMSKSAPNAGRR